MAGLTKEWLKLNIETLELECSDLNRRGKNALAAYKVALAAMEEPAKPVYQARHGEHWRDLNKAQYDDHVNHEVEGLRILYAAPPAAECFIPKNLDRALNIMGMALPESKEEFNFQIERWIQRLIDRVIRMEDELGPQSTPDLREVFEAWAKSKCWDVRRGETGAYISMCTYDGWAVVSACHDAILAASSNQGAN